MKNKSRLEGETLFKKITAIVKGGPLQYGESSGPGNCKHLKDRVGKGFSSIRRSKRG